MFTSVIRTLVPSLVASVVTWLGVNWGVVVSDNTSATAITFVTFLLASGYYLVARTLESKFPQLGVLLGIPKRPVYVAPGSPGVIQEG